MDEFSIVNRSISKPNDIRYRLDPTYTLTSDEAATHERLCRCGSVVERIDLPFIDNQAVRPESVELSPIHEALGGANGTEMRLVYADACNGLADSYTPQLYAYHGLSLCEYPDLFEPRNGIVELVFRDTMTGKRRVLHSGVTCLYLPTEHSSQCHAYAGMFGKPTIRY